MDFGILVGPGPSQKDTSVFLLSLFTGVAGSASSSLIFSELENEVSKPGKNVNYRHGSTFL